MSSCDNCKFYAPSRAVTGFAGECRINPPSKRGRKWPAVNATDFCGKHKPKDQNPERAN